MAEIEIAHGISELPRAEWDALVAGGSPFLEWDWLASLEQSGAVCSAAGWTPRPIAELTLEDFAAALDLGPELILFGTGETHRFPSNHLTTAIMTRGVGFETMTTAAACRTYNVLAAEDRRVVAALLVPA